MKPWKAVMLTCFGVGAVLIGGRSQSVIAASGASGEGSGGTVSYTVGQVACLQVNTVSGAVFQGVQQPFYIVGVEEISGLDVSCSLFPNPTGDQATLMVNGFSSQPLKYQLYDMQGRLIASSDIQGAETTIPLQDLPAATYILTVKDERNGMLSFKIIKTQ